MSRYVVILCTSSQDKLMSAALVCIGLQNSIASVDCIYYILNGIT